MSNIYIDVNLKIAYEESPWIFRYWGWLMGSHAYFHYYLYIEQLQNQPLVSSPKYVDETITQYQQQNVFSRLNHWFWRSSEYIWFQVAKAEFEANREKEIDSQLNDLGGIHYLRAPWYQRLWLSLSRDQAYINYLFVSGHPRNYKQYNVNEYQEFHLAYETKGLVSKFFSWFFLLKDYIEYTFSKEQMSTRPNPRPTALIPKEKDCRLPSTSNSVVAMSQRPNLDGEAIILLNSARSHMLTPASYNHEMTEEEALSLCYLFILCGFLSSDIKHYDWATITEDEISKEYKKLAMVVHPDKGKSQGCGIHEEKERTELMGELVKLYKDHKDWREKHLPLKGGLLEKLSPEVRQLIFKIAKEHWQIGKLLRNLIMVRIDFSQSKDEADARVIWEQEMMKRVLALKAHYTKARDEDREYYKSMKEQLQQMSIAVEELKRSRLEASQQGALTQSSGHLYLQGMSNQTPQILGQHQVPSTDMQSQLTTRQFSTGSGYSMGFATVSSGPWQSSLFNQGLSQQELSRYRQFIILCGLLSSESTTLDWATATDAEVEAEYQKMMLLVGSTDDSLNQRNINKPEDRQRAVILSQLVESYNINKEWRKARLPLKGDFLERLGPEARLGLLNTIEQHWQAGKVSRDFLLGQINHGQFIDCMNVGISNNASNVQKLRIGS